MRQMEAETGKLKETFETLSKKLQAVGVELHNSFEEKQLTLKMMCANYFAKVDLKITETSKNLKSLDKKFNEVESSFINPAKIVDAKLYTVN